MITDLRARLKATAASQAAQAEEKSQSAECLILEERSELAGGPGLLALSAAHVKRLGLEIPAFDVRRALFLDTETTGLRGAGTVAFLVGVGWIEGDEFVVRQYLMRDYPEEAHLLALLGELLPRFDCVVSFNGKSFDMPLLRDRFTMARLRHLWRDLPQLDLLHASRRIWKLRLGSCTLGRLEETVLGIGRTDDLPGAEVPERYFRFLKTGDMDLLDDVLRHNLQDIRTLAALLGRLTAVYEAPEAQTSMLDVFSAGRALEKCGEGELARRCFRVASVSALSQQARLELAQSYRRERDFQAAADVYRGMIARGEAEVDTYVALAILLERRLHDPRGALEITEKAIWRYSGGNFLHHTDAETLAALERRRVRLKKALALEER